MEVTALTDPDTKPPPADAPLPRERLQPGALAPWWRVGARAASFRSLHGLEALQATPLVIACLVIANLLASLLWERLALVGDARFHWQALVGGWLDLLVLAWLCAWIRPQHISAARLLCLALGLQFVIIMALGPWWGVMAQLEWQPPPDVVRTVSWALWLVPQAWWLLAMAVAFRRLGDGHWRAWALAMAVLVGLQVLHWLVPSPRPWSAVAPPDEEEPPALVINEAVLQAQAILLDRQLAALQPPRPGKVDVYVITFAPYGDEDVFSRESAMVAEVMAQRFDAQGRTLQLVNHPGTAEKLPWATGANLARALQRIGQVMDPREDVVFIHLTSHGARDGQLAVGLWPLTLTPVTPQALKGWLDGAGIPQRIVSISACYSGSWVKPLATEASLVMTAADADHTSFGCGRRSPLTFFGRALYDEQLRTRTLSFTQAHAAAREVIRQREIDAGKDDGYSNPQIKVGARIGPVLERLANP